MHFLLWNSFWQYRSIILIMFRHRYIKDFIPPHRKNSINRVFWLVLDHVCRQQNFIIPRHRHVRYTLHPFGHLVNGHTPRGKKEWWWAYDVIKWSTLKLYQIIVQFNFTYRFFPLDKSYFPSRSYNKGVIWNMEIHNWTLQDMTEF